MSEASLVRGYGTRAAGEENRVCEVLEIILKAVGKWKYFKLGRDLMFVNIVCIFYGLRAVYT